MTSSKLGEVKQPLHSVKVVVLGCYPDFERKVRLNFHRSRGSKLVFKVSIVRHITTTQDECASVRVGDPVEHRVLRKTKCIQTLCDINIAHVLLVLLFKGFL